METATYVCADCGTAWAMAQGPLCPECGTETRDDIDAMEREAERQMDVERERA